MFILIAMIAIAVSAGLTLLLVPVVRSLAVRWRFVDAPIEQRLHRMATPLGGGVAMLLAIALPSVLALACARVWHATASPDWLPAQVRLHVPGAAMRAEMALIILAGAAVLCGAGLLDDRRRLGPWDKLLIQVAVAAGVVMLADLRILQLSGEPGSTIVSILWMVVIINAMNFMDNMDGLSAGVTLICATALLGAAVSIGQLFVSGWLCLLIGATAAFLVFNFPPARIFMGDAGSLVLGYMLAVLSMLTTYYDPARTGSRMYGLLVPVVLLAVPLYDCASVMLIRIREKRNPMVGDTRHFSHRLIGRGMSVPAAVLTIYLCTAVTALAAVLLPQVPDWAAWLIAGQTLGVLGIIGLLESADGKP